MTADNSSERAIPKSASAHRLLAEVLGDMGRRDDALSRLQHAVAIAPGDAQTRSDLATMLHERGQTDDAIRQFRKALVLKSDCASAHLGLGIALAAVGNQEEAKRSLETAIALEPENAHGYFNLARAVRFKRDDPPFLAMQRLARNIRALPVEAQVYLHFALGKAFGDVGDYTQSFEHLRQGNTLKRQQWPYMEKKILGWLGRIQSIFTPELLREKSGLGNPSSAPVFILGMHRSGSTLIEQILASHPQCHGAGELTAIDAIAKDLRVINPAGFPEAVPSLADRQLREFADRYLAEIRGLSATAERITDKMPLNFIYTGFIHLLFPNARIIHTRRDPRDTAISCFGIVLGQSIYGQGVDYSSDLAELGRFYRQYRSLMAHWRNVLPAGVMLEVDYETLVEDFENQARRIVAHCGLQWDDACSAFYRNARPVMTASVGQVHQPIYRSSIGRWRHYDTFLEPFVRELEGAGGASSFQPK
jgi:tetratricopeptide (TPR) repeat protein